MQFEITIAISVLSLLVSIFACHQTSKTTTLANKASISMYLIFIKDRTYLKIKNFGNSNALIKSFRTDVDVQNSKKYDLFPFPYVGIKNINIAPGTSMIALLDRKYIDKNHWISVEYFDELTRKNYSFKLEINSYQEYACVYEDNFNLIDY